MSGTRLLSNQGNGALSTAATGSPAPTGTTAGALAGAANGASPFDAILMLEEIAAAASGVGIEAGAAELGTEGAETSADDSADDEDNLELDNPLAFLAGLIAVALRPHPHVATGGAGEGSAGTEGADALAAAPPGDPEAPGIPLLADPGTAATNTKGDAAAAAARALAAQAALGTADPAAQDDKSLAPRAVDFLTHTSRPAPATDAVPMTTHVRDPRWTEEFGARIALLVNQRESVAAISLTPVDLGPVDVSVTVRDSQATIHFGAAQAETRALIEASLPKLRELLAAQGFQLMDASVSQGFTRQSKPDAPSVPRPTSVDEVTPVATRTAVLNGLLDTYA